MDVQVRFLSPAFLKTTTGGDIVEDMIAAAALRKGADWIEQNGWFNLAHATRGDNTSKPACAITSMVYAMSDIPGWGNVSTEAAHKLAEAIEGRKLSKRAPAGLIVGEWNDAQMSGDVVIAKMREVADSLDGDTE